MDLWPFDYQTLIIQYSVMTRVSKPLSLFPMLSSGVSLASSTSHTTTLEMLIAWHGDCSFPERRLIENCHLSGDLSEPFAPPEFL
jgi:hypothetical protein